MSDNFAGIVGATLTPVEQLRGTLGVGRYVVNDYVIDLEPAAGGAGYRLTVARGSEVQSAALYGLTQAQYDDLTALPALALGAYPTDSFTGPAASFSDGADGLPVKALAARVRPSQSGSGDPSPDNPRPVAGHTGLTLCVNGAAVPVSWEAEAGTVYGGTLDVTAGTLTVTHAMVTIDGRDTVYTDKGSSGARDIYYLNIADGCLFDERVRYLTAAEAAEAGLICSVAPFVDSTDFRAAYGATAYIGRGGTRLQLRLTIDLGEGLNTLAKVNQFAAALYDAGTPIRYVYPLKDPVAYRLDPVEIRTRLGDNVIFADTGDVSVTWRADPTLFAARDQTEDDMTADAPIASGAYFQIGSTLYRAAAAIATGETIVPGGNCAVTNIAEALNLLNA